MTKAYGDHPSGRAQPPKTVPPCVLMTVPRRPTRRASLSAAAAILVPLLYQLLRQGWIVAREQHVQDLDFRYERFVLGVLGPPPSREPPAPDSNRSHASSSPPDLSHNNRTSSAAAAPPPLAACLMFKDDNELFQEWLAYHYTAFSLRYLVLGEDFHNAQDPRSVLHLYNGSDLRYWIWPPEHFTSIRHTVSGNVTKFQAHRALVVRQKHFVTQCLKFVQSHLLPHVKWTLLIDPDEYLVVRPLNHNSSRHNSAPHGPASGSVVQEHSGAAPEDQDFAFTPLYRFAPDAPPCVTLPRLLVGPLENRSCVRDSHLSTLRFAQHATPNDFSYSGYAKVVVDASRLSLPSSGIKSIHRPVTKCPHAGVTLYQHLLRVASLSQQQQQQQQSPQLVAYLHHYHGSWEQYASRGDARRDSAEWNRRSSVDDGTVDCSAARRWLPAFARVGPPAAVQALRPLAGRLLDGG